jgi:hypothetical protein
MTSSAALPQERSSTFTCVSAWSKLDTTVGARSRTQDHFMTPLDDKTALITGGIGRAVAFQLAQRGVDVAVAARSQDELA